MDVDGWREGERQGRGNTIPERGEIAEHNLIWRRERRREDTPRKSG